MNLQELEHWNYNKGEYTHRINYNLDKNSIVFDLGGYTGEWSKMMSNIYHCNIFIFEPLKKYYNSIVSTMYFYEKIKVYNYGLAAKTEKRLIYLNNDSTSLHIKTNQTESIQLINFKTFIIDNNIPHIHLLKINIEGAEYDLLNYIIKCNLHTKIQNIQVQFHDFMRGANKRRKIIRDKLLETHKLTYDYDFVWSNFQLK